MMEVQYDNDGNQAKIYCKAYGAPPLHFQFQWYRITGRNKTKLSGNYNANQGSSIINVLPIDRRKVEQTGKIICIARNTLIKDSQCQYQGNVNPLDDATWMVTLISILGSGTLTLCIIGVLLKVTRNQTITGLARTLVTILSREVLIIQTQPFLTEDIEEFRKEIGATYKARVFYIDNTTAWADMRTVVANLKRFKVVICIISEKILHEGVSNLQFKDFLCKIITKCIEKENVTGMPPILILKKEEFNHSHYPDDVDQLECIDIHLKDEQFQQLLKSHLTNEQIQWLEDHFTDQQFKQLLKIYYNDQSFQLLRENCLTHEQFLMLLVSHLDDDQYQQLLKTQLTGEQIQYLEDHLNQRQLRQWIKNYFTNQQLQILQESRLSTDQELQQLVENQLTDDLLQSFLQTRLTDEQIQWLKDHLTPQQLKQLLKNYSINRQFQPLLIALLTNEQLELLLQSHLIDDQFQQLLKNSLTSQQIQWLENHLADQQSKQFQQVQTNRLSTEQFRQLTESHLTHDQYEQLLESFARFYYYDWKD
ncbi:uncharacterized protein TRIADDRAFT_52089 [Trichoplax adhaerens]|uniref:Ig-like domain-containing protein n=1 Tax=Trichoplax adhaerens TaxID=10228 RepID=B3RLR0_TRIAD|nr:predicted protein [Trichoplax adhaerens]EDV28826.1 predicted protein [Trichoplax adhaerens]|eukprot:XP_002108028.1 predicted protein [Trichoplax adhaerens]